VGKRAVPFHLGVRVGDKKRKRKKKQRRDEPVKKRPAEPGATCTDSVLPRGRKKSHRGECQIKVFAAPKRKNGEKGEKRRHRPQKKGEKKENFPRGAKGSTQACSRTSCPWKIKKKDRAAEDKSANWLATEKKKREKHRKKKKRRKKPQRHYHKLSRSDPTPKGNPELNTTFSAIERKTKRGARTGLQKKKGRGVAKGVLRQKA